MATFIESLIPSVHDTLSLREALSKLASFEHQIKSQGVCSIVDNFNIIYSCFCHIKDLKTETLDEILNTLIKGLTLLETDLKKILNDKLTSETRIKYLNTLKILTFLIVEFSNFLEKKYLNAKDSDLLPQANKKTTKKTTSKKNPTTSNDLSINETSGNFDWNGIKEKVLDCLSRIILLNVQKLWDPPIAEEQFVIIITNLCYKLMETCQSNSIRPQQRKVLKDHLCHILGIMIKKYNHSYGACVMIIQTLPHYEHFSSLYADLIQTCVLQLSYESILPDILREFRHINLSAGAGSSANPNKENPNLKFYSQFLTDLADRLAGNFLPYLSLIQEFLDEESYLMRNSILYIYGEIITKILNKSTQDLKSKQMRDELLGTLCEHIHDSNALTRSKTLQIWRKISEENAIPLHFINKLMKRCVGRMEDVASSVRKSAFQLLCDLIRKNPFGIKSVEMSMDQIHDELVKEEEVLNGLNKESDKLIEELNRLVENNGKNGSNEDMELDGEDDNDDDDSDADNDKTRANQTILAKQNHDSNDLELQAKKEKHDQLVVIQKSKVNYLKDMLSFVNQIETAIPKLSKLLFSKTQTDVLEVISFFVTCYEHGFTDMLFGIRKMLALVINSEKTIKDAVINAYKRLYLKSESSKHSSLQIAKQLIKLTQDLSICERGALEELVGEFVINGELESSVIQIFWEIFADVEKPPQTRLNALMLLTMIIKKVPGKGRANIQVLIDYGLSLSGQNETETQRVLANDHDMLRITETCLALSFITPDASTKQLTQIDLVSKSNEVNKKDKRGKEKDNDLGSKKTGDHVQPRLQFNNEPFKLVNSHLLFQRLNEIIIDQFSNLNTKYWTPMVENAIHCIFKLADNPISIVESIILKFMDKIAVFKSLMIKNSLPPAPLFNEASQQSDAAAFIQTDEAANFKCNASTLTRFFSLVGIVATKLIVFLNQFVICELKRRKMCKENQENVEKISKVNNNKSKRKSMRPGKSINRQSLGTSDAALEEEMGMQGAEAEDVELMFIESVVDNKIALSQPNLGLKSLIASLLPGIIHILKDQAKYPDETLQLACSMTLVRTMILSQKLCNENLQLLFTLMEKSPNPKIRSQLILGIGDLVFRFPNALEPWTSHLYFPLRDTKSTAVRMNTIRVLSHLILKEMIKTRGQIYEIALCTIDPDLQISSLAKLFFQELSQRNNGLVIYNAMPDIISQLSGGGGGGGSAKDDQEILNARLISEESFKTIVTYLFSFIKRDKQCETLIEKLCHGFRQANISERKCRDLVFCLSKIQLSENGIKKLKETFKWYADKLIYQVVYETFKNTIIKNARKLPMLRNETKSLIDELEKQIDDIKQKGLSDEVGAYNEENANEENHNNSDSDSDSPVPVQQAKSRRDSRQVANKRSIQQSQVPVNRKLNSAKPVPQKANLGKKMAPSKFSNTSRTRRKVVVQESSSEEDDKSQSDDDEDDDNDKMSDSD